MDTNIIPRAAISADAKLAAERCIATGVEQLNPNLQDTDAFAQWAADYARHLHEMRAEEGTEGAA